MQCQILRGILASSQRDCDGILPGCWQVFSCSICSITGNVTQNVKLYQYISFQFQNLLMWIVWEYFLISDRTKNEQNAPLWNLRHISARWHFLLISFWCIIKEFVYYFLGFRVMDYLWEWIWIQEFFKCYDAFLKNPIDPLLSSVLALGRKK